VVRSDRLADDRPQLLRRRPSRVAQIDLVVLAGPFESPLRDERVQPLDRRGLGSVRADVQHLRRPALGQRLEVQLRQGLPGGSRRSRR
jgi:hypothetical protein